MFAGEVDLKTWYKPKIDKKTLKELSKRSNIKGLLDISVFIFALILSGYLCIISWGSLWSIPALLLYGNIFYCKIISIQHETNHETYFKTRALNKFFYHITSLLGGFEAVRWKWSHFHHHTYTIFTHEEVYDYENNSPKPTEPVLSSNIYEVLCKYLNYISKDNFFHHLLINQNLLNLYQLEQVLNF